MYIKVIVELSIKKVDKEFIYHVPDDLIDKVKVGIRVKVPFNNRKLEGFITEINSINDTDFIIKDIESVVDNEPLLTDEMMYLASIMKETSLSSMVSIYQIMLPKALKASYKTNINIKYSKYLKLNITNTEAKLYISKTRSNKQKELLERLLTNNKLYITKLEPHIKVLLDKKIIILLYEEENRYKIFSDNINKDIILNDNQKEVVYNIEKAFNTSSTYLLYGVTGSGKTEVYIKLIKKALEIGKTALLLVPEISLTTQIILRLYNVFNDNIAVIHSGLSESEKYDQYRLIKEGKRNIVIGTRSCIFAPINNIGIIILDEEQSSSYKETKNPKYHARDIAILRSKYHKCPVILGSATPSLESFARAGNKVYHLETMLKRNGDSTLPKITIVDMKKEAVCGNFILSKLLLDKINEEITKGFSIILFLNRRGYSTILSCPSCGTSIKCPNCDISLTYHKTFNYLSCHLCGYKEVYNPKCKKCGNNIKDLGLGIEKVEEYLNTHINNAKVIRMDTDTTSKKGMHDKIINDFANNKYNILLGTSMIAKGLDFPNVTLVGVIQADMSLNIPDFRSSENTFELLSQVSGRAGRGNTPGEVIIQTYNPNNYVINYAKNHDYLGFYRYEMNLRKKLKYIPYYYISLVTISSKNYNMLIEESTKIFLYLKNNLEKDTIILTPSTNKANITKINNIYYIKSTIKYRKDDKLLEVFKFIDNKYIYNNYINIDIDISI